MLLYDGRIGLAVFGVMIPANATAHKTNKLMYIAILYLKNRIKPA